MGMKQLLAAASMVVGSVAYAGGNAGGSGAPAVELTGVPEQAVQRPEGQPDRQHPVEARLFFEQTQVAPGSTGAVGVHLVQDAEWHTYWKTPGDIGLPTELAWTLPEGVTVSSHVFPIPHRYEVEGMVSYGYNDQVLHIGELNVDDSVPPGTYPIAVEASWLVCKTSCIPGQVKLESQLVVGEGGEATAQAPLFTHFRDQWPDAMGQLDGVTIETVFSQTPILPDTKFQVAYKITPDEGHTLTVPTEVWPAFAPILGPDWMVDGVTIKPIEGGGFAVVVDGSTFFPEPMPTDDVLGGLFQVELDGKTMSTEFTAEMPWAAAGAAVAKSSDPVFAAAAVEAPVAEAEVAEAAAAAAPAAWNPMMILTNLGLAFVGGLILNLMPCVLPVLTLKLYGLVEQAGITDAEKKKGGLGYTAGILVSFWALASAVWGARAILGDDVGWGFQFQYPGYVAALATLVFVFGLSLFGVFEIPAFGTNSAHEMGSKEGAAGYFFTGVFATLVSTPCSAPFLGTAIAFAFQAPTWMLFLVFSFVGLGLAFPFLLIAFVPAAYKLLPKPGPWMDGFKTILGFTLIGTTVWLLSVLFAQIGVDNGVDFVAFLTIVAFGAWMFGHFGGVAADAKRQVGAFMGALAVIALGGYRFLNLDIAEASECVDDVVAVDTLQFDHEIPWQAFSDGRVDSLKGKPIFIDFTADWCVSCKVNEKTVLETEQVRQKMAELGVVPLKADWTRKDDKIKAWLNRFNRDAVPMYLVIPPGGVEEALLLPEVITPKMVVDALEEAKAG